MLVFEVNDWNGRTDKVLRASWACTVVWLGWEATRADSSNCLIVFCEPIADNRVRHLNRFCFICCQKQGLDAHIA